MKSSSKRSLQSNAVTLHLSKNSNFNSGNLPSNKQTTQLENGQDAPKLSPMKSNRGKQSTQTQQQQQQQLKSLANQIPRANLDLSSQQFQFSNQHFYGEMQVATSSQSIGSQVSNGSQKSSSSQVSSSRIYSTKSRSSSQKTAHNLDNGLGGTTHINNCLNGEQLFMKLCNNNTNNNNPSGVQQHKSCLPSPPKVPLNTSNNNNTSFSAHQIHSNSSILPSEKYIFQGMTTPTSPSAENEPLPQIQKSFSNSTEHYNQQVALDLLNRCIVVSNYKEANRVFQASNFTIHDISNYRDKISNNLLIHSLAMRADSVLFLKFLESSLPGIDLNLFNSHGWTPLMLACMKGNYEVSHYLASHKRVDVNAQDLSGNSALHIACMYGHRKIVEMLLGQRLLQSNLKNNEDKYPKDLTQDSKIMLLFSKLRKVNLDQSQSCTSIAMDLTLNSSTIREQIYQESPRRASRQRNTNPLLSLTSSAIQQPLRSHSNSSYSSSHQTIPNGLSSTSKHLNKAITKNSFFNLKQSVNYSNSHINSPSINSSFSSNKCSQANSPNVAYLTSSTNQTKAKPVLSTFSTASQSAQYRQIQKTNDIILKGIHINNISQIQEYATNGIEETSPIQQYIDISVLNNSNASNIMSSQVLLRAKSGIMPAHLQTASITMIERGSYANQNCDQSDFISRQGQLPTESRQDKYSRYAIQQTTTQTADNSILIMSKISSANLTLNNHTLNESSSPLINTEPLENDSPLISKGNICSPFKGPMSNSSWKGTNPNSNSISKILEKKSRSRSQNQNSSKHKTLLTTPSQAQNKSPNKYKSQQGQTTDKIAAFNPQVYSNGGNISTAASSKLCSVDKANGANSNNTNKVSSDSNESTDQINHPSLALSAKISPLIFSAGKTGIDKKPSTQFQSTFQSPLPFKSSQSMQVYSSQEINPFQSSGVSQLQKQKTLEIPFQKPQDYIITPISYVNEPPQKGIESYRILSHLGSGNYGDVFLVEHLGNNKKYAMKLLDKEKLASKNMLKYAIAERNVMQKCNSPFIVKMIHSFQTDSYLVIVMEYCPGGDLYSCLLQKKRFDEEIARKYLSEILLAVEELHYHDVIYRDMKPENIVLGSDGHVKLIDFGLSRENIGEGAAQSFCGSAVYLAPEIISKKGHNKSVDWYQFGVLAYELLVGQPPFNQLDRKELYFHIQNKKVEYPSFLSDKAKSLISALLNKNPEERLGSGRADAYQIKDHPFFNQTNWFDVKSKIHSMPIPQISEKRKDTKVDPKIYQTQHKDSINVPQWYFLNILELF